MKEPTESTGETFGGSSVRPPAIVDLHDTVQRVRDSIAAAAVRSGRAEDEVALLAVTKRKSPEMVRAAHECGLRLFGENYVQEAVDKAASANVADAEWHLIGHLQSNKTRVAIQTFTVIESVDSEKIARNLSRIASECGIHQRVLIQVHLGNEATKTGAPPEEALELAAIAASLPGLALKGLMGIAPLGEDPRPHFRSLRKLFDELPQENRLILSMGMSSDYPTAIEEGATMVRIGSALFGSRL
jgi:hypothetical protein